MEFENASLQTNDPDELIIEFPEPFSRPKYFHSQVVDAYVDWLFKYVYKLTDQPFKRIVLEAEVPVMRSAITKLLLDYEKVLMDRFIVHLDDAATQIQDDSGYSLGPLADGSGGPG